MYECLKGLEPARVFELFGELCRIPHGSKNEKAISDYICRFCEDRGLEVWQDEAYNLIIKKDATPGYENAPTVILQAHLDMVCEKNAGTDHDFTKDPIPVLRDGDRIYADGTTLGADDGTGVAFAMAVLEADDIPHPRLAAGVPVGAARLGAQGHGPAGGIVVVAHRPGTANIPAVIVGKHLARSGGAPVLLGQGVALSGGGGVWPFDWILCGASGSRTGG